MLNGAVQRRSSSPIRRVDRNGQERGRALVGDAALRRPRTTIDVFIHVRGRRSAPSLP